MGKNIFIVTTTIIYLKKGVETFALRRDVEPAGGRGVGGQAAPLTNLRRDQNLAVQLLAEISFHLPPSWRRDLV